MNSEKVIDPYVLLGVDPYNPDMKLLKKNFYQLVLKHHPDRGGSKRAMRTVRNAYDSIKLQFLNCQNRKSHEQREEESKKDAISLNNSSKNKYNKVRFNKAFEDEKKTKHTSFDHGYGDYMTGSEYAAGKLSYDKNKIHEQQKHIFKNIDDNMLTIYKEPKSYQEAYGNHERFDVKKISDFSYSSNGLYMSDYKNAFKIIGEENMNKITVKKRYYKDYIQKRVDEKHNYKMFNTNNQSSTEDSSSGSTEESSSEID